MIAQRRGIVTVPGEIARRAWAVPVSRVAGPLGTQLAQAGRQFIANYHLNGLEYMDAHDIHAYGPFASMRLLEPMLDPETMGVTEVEAQALVMDEDASPAAFAHYLIVADFLAKKPVLSIGE